MMKIMDKKKKLIVSHPPFYHIGANIRQRSFNIMFAALLALIPGIFQYGIPALGVVSLCISSAVFWEMLVNKLTKHSFTIEDGNAALIGMILAMLLPAVTPWWFVITASFIAVVIGKGIFGGIGGNSFNPVAVSMAIIAVSWKGFLNFDQALLNFDFGFDTVYHLGALKAFGLQAVQNIDTLDLLLGKQIGGIGSTFGIGLIIGGIYLMLTGSIRWEISISFIIGVFITALIFNTADPARFAGPGFHISTGYTLIGAFFLATEDSSSPVNFVPMLIYGAGGGIMTILIRNIGAYSDGVILAILVMNLINPIIDKIRPQAIGKVINDA